MRGMIGALLLAFAVVGCGGGGSSQQQPQAQGLNTTVYRDAHSAMQARCDKGDQSACDWVAKNKSSNTAGATGQSASGLNAAEQGTCDTACCAMCTRCVNTGDCTYCQANCG